MNNEENKINNIINYYLIELYKFIKLNFWDTKFKIMKVYRELRSYVDKLRVLLIPIYENVKLYNYIYIEIIYIIILFCFF